MKFTDTLVNKDHRFSLGREETSGRFYLSIPVSNRLVDYEEYYQISENDYNAYFSDFESAFEFIGRCRSRMNDHLLLVPPGADRGTS